MNLRIIELRKNRGLTQAELAKKLNTTQSYISRIENNKCEISPFILADMANLFGVSIDYLMGKIETSSQIKSQVITLNDIMRDINEYDEVIARYKTLNDEHKAAVKLNLDFYYNLENR